MSFRLFLSFLGASFPAVPSEVVHVNSATELYNAVELAHHNYDVREIILGPGIYHLSRRILFQRNNISLVGKNGPQQTILIGKGMKKSRYPEVLMDIMASHITIGGITLKNSGNHLIQVRAENNADFFRLSNSILQDSYEQMLKISGDKSAGHYSENGIVEHCVFEYTAGIGPQFYIGGIDAHRSIGWQIRNNIFRNIASPSSHIAEHAIHFWQDSGDTHVIGNTIINSDRGIGFGLGKSEPQHYSGLIEENTIVHTDMSHPFADVGIALESSEGAIIQNNTILLYSGYPNAIEYRFASTQNVLIRNNKVNKRIKKRDGATALLKANRHIN
ncbi:MULTISPECIES: right-handed parallel beta-helix repeat-containing protein [unclassified Alteromonas]|uniref:right-handed parallel beta-helix repeat-containing protein n=1 Tax=unclassified Alteromonas TaxID=2614992 RepID=UPI000691E5E1|nr:MULTISPECIES: right-handed parallel beta-helix repeat-containing protein [unclassified Alteromonas]